MFEDNSLVGILEWRTYRLGPLSSLLVVFPYEYSILELQGAGSENFMINMVDRL